MRLLLVLSVFLFSNFVQSQGLLTRNFSANEGFKSQSGWTIFTDSRGLIWADMGSEGVAIWDGQNFTYLTEKDGMGANMVNAFGEGSDGRIYIGCQGKGLSIYDGYRFENYSKADSVGLTSDNIMSMWLHSSGDLYMGAHSGGLYIYDDGHFEKLLDSAYASISVFDIKEDKNGEIWFTTGTQGLGHLSDSGCEFFGDSIGLPQSLMLDLEFAENGDIYLGNHMGLFRMRDRKIQKSWTFSQDGVSSDKIQAMVVLESQDVIFSTVDGAFLLRNDSITQIGLHGQIKAHLTEITLDKNGNPWATTNGDGLCQILLQDIWAYKLPATELSLRKLVQFPNGDILFVGIKNIYRLTETGYEKLGDDLETKVARIINAYVIEQDKLLLLTKSNGLGVFEKIGGEWVMNIFNESKSVDFAEPRDDGKWIALARYQMGEVDLDKRVLGNVIMPTQGEAILLPFEGNGEVFWAGRYDKPGILEIGNEDTVMISEEHGLASNSVIHLQLDRNGTLWYLNLDGDFGYRKSKYEYVSFNGYSSNGAFNLTFDLNNDLWIHYKDIIVLVDLEDYKIKRTRLFGKGDGIHNAAGRFHENVVLEDGRILILKAQDQVYVFDPSKITFPDESPDLFVKQINGKDDVFLDSSWVEKPSGIYQTPSKIDLPFTDNHLTVHLGASYFTSPDSLRFMYYLEGLDKDWSIPQESGDITITNIPNGKYVLKLKAVGAMGNESEIISIPVIVQTPWYKSWLFYVGLVLFLGVLVLLFLKWRTKKLRSENLKLEETVSARTLEVVKEKEKVEEKNREIEDSIKYAQRIQRAILPPDKMVKEFLDEAFVVYLPKDIVAGDFYWLEPAKGGVLFAAADCTGHGVPGAMVSVICNSGLNRSVREYGLQDPGAILSKTREIVIGEFEKSEEEVKDGMDIALCGIFEESGKRILRFAGAHNPVLIMRENEAHEDGVELIEIKGDKQPIGKFVNSKPFTTQEVELSEGDMIYVFSDGYPDQFGGAKGKKFKMANLKKLLKKLSSGSVENQKSELIREFEEWKGDLEQLDDICIIGVRI